VAKIFSSRFAATERRKYSEVTEELKQVPYKVVPGPNDAVRIDIDGKLYSPEEISS
jgi:molecular chaperone DnaK